MIILWPAGIFHHPTGEEAPPPRGRGTLNLFMVRSYVTTGQAATLRKRGSLRGKTMATDARRNPITVASAAVRIDVADTGPGIQDEDRNRLFEPFFTTKANGSGLGLAIVQGTAARHPGPASSTTHAWGTCRTIVSRARLNQLAQRSRIALSAVATTCSASARRASGS